VGEHGPRRDYGRVRERSYSGGYDREKRLQITIAVGAAIMLFIGIGLGFALGRATASKTAAPAEPTSTVIVDETTLPVGVVEDVPTESIDASFTDDVILEQSLEDTTPPSKPKQLAPANGAVLTTSRVYLRWSKSKDDSGSVTYSFQLQDRLTNGTYGRTQTFKRLTTRSYSVRVLQIRRRWRVWAVDEAGNRSKFSPWHTYIKKYVPPPPKKSTNPTPTSSNETT
jgi:hypothetical protein